MSKRRQTEDDFDIDAELAGLSTPPPRASIRAMNADRAAIADWSVGPALMKSRSLEWQPGVTSSCSLSCGLFGFYAGYDPDRVGKKARKVEKVRSNLRKSLLIFGLKSVLIL